MQYFVNSLTFLLSPNNLLYAGCTSVVRVFYECCTSVVRVLYECYTRRHFWMNLNSWKTNVKPEVTKCPFKIILLWWIFLAELSYLNCLFKKLNHRWSSFCWFHLFYNLNLLWRRRFDKRSYHYQVFISKNYNNRSAPVRLVHKRPS